MSNTSNSDTNLVIRFSENLRTKEGVIELHNNVVDKAGFVVFGKMGNKLSQSRIDELNNEIHKEEKRFLYLVKSQNKKTVVFKAEIVKAFIELPAKEKKYIPSYYYDYGLPEFIHSWIKVTKLLQVESNILASLRAIGSLSPLNETLGRSSAGHFWVHEKK